MKAKWVLGSILVVLLIVAAVLSNTSVGQALTGGKSIAESQTTTSTTPAPNVGAQAPAFALPALHGGQQVSLASLKGKRVLINFWASWCGPCKNEMPDLQKEYQKYQDRIIFYAINLNDEDDTQKAEQFLKDHGITIPVLLDDKGKANDAYQIHSVPTTFAIGPNGAIVDRFVGAMNQQQMDALIQHLLAN